MADEGQQPTSQTPPIPSLKLTPKTGEPPKPGSAPKFRVTKSPFAPKVTPVEGGTSPTPESGAPVPAPAQEGGPATTPSLPPAPETPATNPNSPAHTTAGAVPGGSAPMKGPGIGLPPVPEQPAATDAPTPSLPTSPGGDTSHGPTPTPSGPSPSLEAPKLAGGPDIGGIAPSPSLAGDGPKPALEAPKGIPGGPSLPSPGGTTPSGGMTTPGGPPGGSPVGAPSPIGAPPGGPAAPTPDDGQGKKAGPSIFFMVIDFLVFGSALTIAILLWLKYS